MSMEPESRDYLLVNLDLIKEELNKNCTDLSKNFGKLYDHVELEIIRLSKYYTYEQNEEKLKTQINTANSNYQDITLEILKAKKEFDHTESEISKANKQLSILKKQIASAQTTYVSILGIFSSIIFTLFGGLNVFSQVFSKITNLNTNKEFFGILTIGGFVVFSIFNLLNLMLYSLGKFIEKDLINTKCKENCKEQKCNCNWFKKMFKKYTHITIANISIVVLIIACLYFYLKG